MILHYHLFSTSVSDNFPNFFTIECILTSTKVVKHWNRLPREIVDVPFLEVFQTKLDESLKNLLLSKLSLPMAEGLELDELSGPFQPKPFCDSVKTDRILSTINLVQQTNKHMADIKEAGREFLYIKKLINCILVSGPFF
ncbi:hypothetical protein DUI87_05777 [Hirundo rustica rustica]|uniref:Uncharacterized protein n=1 Tax=Hirundo rustica rustica TaxID=333673 RepID=A0A3M0L2F5_HIRRU|nr:hypothetical protein DUI87_05777 [Hirundo rustica rustica]